MSDSISKPQSTATNTVILITGSSTGFGRSAAETLARHGYRVFATMRDLSGRNASTSEDLRSLANRKGWRFSLLVRRPHEVRTRPLLAVLLSLILAPALSKAVELKQQTVQAWETYVRGATMRMEKRASGQSPFLWVDEKPDRVQRVRAGEVLVAPVDGENPHTVPHGLIHDWIGAMFLPNAKLDDVMGVLNDYDHYKDFYKPMVVKSQLLEQTPEHAKISLLMMHKAFSVTAAVQTDNEVRIVRPVDNRAYSLSNSVRVQEVADYGKPREHTLPEGQGPGYVWRVFSVTRLEQRDGGVYVEMETIAMSRGIPLALRWMIKPLVEAMPRKVMLATLTDTRDAVGEEVQAASMKTQTVAQAMGADNRDR